MVVNGSSKIKNICLYTALLFAIGGLPLCANATQLTLKNGDKITGDVVRLTDEMLIFDAAILGEVKIPWWKVETVDSDEDIVIQLADGTKVKGKINIDEAGHLSITRSDTTQTNTDNNATDASSTADAQPDQTSSEEDESESKYLTRDALVALNPPVIDPSTKYRGHANFGGTFNRGNSVTDDLNIDAEFIARKLSSRYTVGFEINDTKSSGVQTTSNSHLLGQYDSFLNRKDYLFVNAKAEYDREADLRLRSSLGTGYGRQIIESEVRNLSAEAGFNLVNEDYIIAPNRSFPALSLGMKFNQKFFNNTLVFFNNANLDTNLNDPNDSLVKNRLGIRMPIGKAINVGTQFNVDYNNQPVANTKKTDTSVIFSLGYGF